MQYNNQPQQKPSPTFGAIQQNFVYYLSKFQNGDQFTIIEDMPRSKPVRSEQKMSKKNTPYTVYRIRISSNGIEADLEMMEFELSQVAVVCPRDIQNFRGSTLSFDGRRWTYICGEMPTPATNTNTSTQAQSAPITQPEPPRVNVANQTDTFIAQFLQSIELAKKLGHKVDSHMLFEIAKGITPTGALDLVATTKTKGLITEKDGTYVVV